jgi:hypothetical protein
MAEVEAADYPAEPGHRGRIQAQGSGTEESEAWARSTPPTESEMLTMCDELARKLSPRELRDRDTGFRSLRRFIRAAAAKGGIQSPVSKHFKKHGHSDIRVDLEVITGSACVPDDGIGG